MFSARFNCPGGLRPDSAASYGILHVTPCKEHWQLRVVIGFIYNRSQHPSLITSV